MNCLVPMRRFEEATREIRLAQEFDPLSPAIQASLGLGSACALAGQADRARRILEELKQRRRERYVSAALIAEVHAGLGETEEALSWLGEAEREGSPELCWIGVRPAFSRLRPQPRFAELVRTIGLPAA